MYRLSSIISEIYNKLLPLAEKSQIQLSLDFPDTTQTINDPEVIKSDLEQHLNSALARTKKNAGNQITVAVRKSQIIITDTGTILSKPICAMMSNSRVNVKSRIGFGTTVTINLPPSNKKLQ